MNQEQGEGRPETKIGMCKNCRVEEEITGHLMYDWHSSTGNVGESVCKT